MTDRHYSIEALSSTDRAFFVPPGCTGCEAKHEPLHPVSVRCDGITATGFYCLDCVDLMQFYSNDWHIVAFPKQQRRIS